MREFILEALAVFSPVFLIVALLYRSRSGRLSRSLAESDQRASKLHDALDAERRDRAESEIDLTVKLESAQKEKSETLFLLVLILGLLAGEEERHAETSRSLEKYQAIAQQFDDELVELAGEAGRLEKLSERFKERLLRAMGERDALKAERDALKAAKSASEVMEWLERLARLAFGLG